MGLPLLPTVPTLAHKQRSARLWTPAAAGGGAPEAVEAHTTHNEVNTQAISLVRPATLQDNDIEIIIAGERFTHGGAYSYPTGFVEKLDTGLVDLLRILIAWRRWNTGDPTINVAVDRAGNTGQPMGGFVLRVRGAATSGDPFDVVGAVATHTGEDTPNPPSITTVTANSLIVMPVITSGYVTASAWGCTDPAVLTEYMDSAISGNFTMHLATAAQGAVGATGVGATTLTGAARHMTLLFAIKP